MDILNKYKKADGTVDYQAMAFFLKTDTSAKNSMAKIKAVYNAELDKKIQREKATYYNRQVALTKAASESTPYMNSVFGQHLGRIDSATYYRWKLVDPTFWSDINNINKYMRDNPEAKRRH